MAWRSNFSDAKVVSGSLNSKIVWRPCLNRSVQSDALALVLGIDLYDADVDVSRKRLLGGGLLTILGYHFAKYFFPCLKTAL